jgi:hypothetical protein
VDVRAPGVRVLRVRVVRRGRSRTLVATFRLTERARVLLRVLKGRRVRAARRTVTLRAGRLQTVRVAIGRRVPRGIHVAELVARDAAGNFTVQRRGARL